MENQELKRTLGFFPALATVMGTVIGAGVFFKAAKVAADTGNIGLHLLAWLLGGIISICAGLTAAELAAAIPETGGMIRYIERGFGKTAGFLLGWAQTVIYFPANIAAIAIVFGAQLVSLFGWSNSLAVPLAIIAAISLTLINFIGSKAGGMIQSVTLVLKLIPLVLIVIFGLFSHHNVNFHLLPIAAGTVDGHQLSFFPALGAALLATMFAYDGWIYAGNIAGEMKNPAKHLPRAIIIGLAGIMVIYLLVNTAYLKTLGLEHIMGNANAPLDVANTLFGGIGGKLVTLGICISAYGAVNGYTMTGMRTAYVLASEKSFPFWKQFSKLSENTKVPVNAGILQVIIAVLMMIVSSFSSDAFNMLTDMLVFVIWIFYTLVFIAVFVLRKKEPELNRPYKVPIYPIIPIIAIAGGIFIIFMTLLSEFWLALFGIIITLIGFPIYRYMSKKYK